ncbi:MAG: hypothetical protein VB949_03830, partial [Pseudomonadales bacterium]
GKRIDPQVACVSPMMVHNDETEAIRRGLEGGNFFGYSLAYYIAFGDYKPGSNNLWRDFREKRAQRGYDPEAAIAERMKLGAKFAEGKTTGLRGCVGTPDQLRDYLRRYEDAGVDQLIFILQAGNNRHEHIMEALELFGKEVMPEFQERDEKQRQTKLDRLAPLLDAAMERRVDNAPALPDDFRVDAIAREVFKDMGGDEMLDKLEEDSALGKHSDLLRAERVDPKSLVKDRNTGG